MIVGDKAQVRIEKLVFGGTGLARLNRQVIFVPYAVPEDLLDIEITVVKKNHLEAKIVSVIEPSPHRVKAPCPYFGACGGCDWQNVDYSEQLRQKQMIVADALLRIGKISADVNATVPSPSIWNYRNRIQLHRIGDKAGFRRSGSHETIAIDRCLIADDDINKQLTGPLPKTDRFEFRVRSLPSQGFAQVNSQQNQNLIDWLALKVGPIKSSIKYVLDLYGGHGNFSIPLSANLENALFTVVELSAASVTSGKTYVESKGLASRISFRQSDVADFLKTHPLKQLQTTLVLLDPPRNGCDERVLENLLRMKPRQVFYVSCNPTTLARDLSVLKTVYSIREVQPFDMFPHTGHIETAVWLESFPT